MLAAVIGLAMVSIGAVAQRSVEPGPVSPPGRDGDAVAAVRQTLIRQGVPGQERWRNTVASNGRGGWTVSVWTGQEHRPSRPLGSPDVTYDVVDCVNEGGLGVAICLRPSSSDRTMVDLAGVRTG